VAGMKAAKRRGQHLGRPPKLSEYQRREALSMLDAGKARADVAALLGVHVGTLRRALKGLAGSGRSHSKGKNGRLCTGRKRALAANLFDRRGH
jgi:DNA invertase Pin-like site-specific DNA recombinase